MTAAIDITGPQRKALLAILRRFIPGVVVWAYGSRVKFTARPNSDLDLVVFTTPAQRHVVSELKDELAESDLPFLVDLHVWDEVPEKFHDIIRKEYAVVQEAKDAAKKSATSSWRASTWGDEISLEYGKALRDYDKERGKFRVFGSNGPIGWTSQPLAQGPGVILGRKGAYRGIEFSREPFFVIDTAYYVVPKTETDMRWLYYAIKFHKLGEIDDGSPIPSTTRSAVYVRDFDIPPLAEQKSIAAVLGALDDKIEVNRRMNATLEAMARALFQSWFVDFDPVRAKLDARPPAGLDLATAALFPDSFQDSPLGHIPSGWSAVPLYDTAQWVNGAAFKSEDFCAAGDGLPVIKIGELKDGIGAQTKWCERQAGPNQIIDTGDLLYSWSGSPDSSLEAFLWSGGRGLLNQHIFKVISSTAAQKRFVYYLLQYLRPVLVETARNKQTTGLGHVTIADMKRLLVCLPSKEVLAAFDRSVAAIFGRAFANTLESRTLTTLRDTLLPKLLSGELSVASAEQIEGRIA